MSATTSPPATDSTTTRRDAGAAGDAGRLVLRVLGGGILAIHGFQNLGDPAGHIAGTRAFGIPFPEVTGWLSLLGEVGLGLLLVVGLLTRVAGALAAVLMATTWAVAHASEGLITDAPGVNGENALLLATIGLSLALLGGGRWALDAVLLPRVRRRA